MGIRRLALSACLLFGSLVILCRPSDAKIVVGIASVNVAFLPLYVSLERGFFDDEDLDIVPVMFNAGNTNLQAMIGGDVQIMAGAVAETVIGKGNGIDVKNFWGICNLMPFELYSNPKLTSM